jgi:drug/metabolite transporter (DMT)-like permease
MGSTFLGLGLMLISTSCMNVGTVIQKKAVDKLPAMEEQTISDNVKGVVGNKLWLVGWLLTTLAMLLNMIALGQADMTVIQPLIGFGLIVLVIFSRYYLGEEINKMGILGILVAIIGVIILGLTASESRAFSSTEEVLESYSQVNAILIIVIFLVFIAVLWIGTIKMKYKGAGIIFAIIAASFSVIGLTFSKGVFSVIDIESIGTALTIWQEYLLLFIFICCSTMAIAVQQMSLQKGKSIVVTPVFNLCSIVFPLATGYMVFSEVIGPGKIIATILIFVGAILLSIKPKPIEEKSNQAAENKPKEEKTIIQ